MTSLLERDTELARLRDLLDSAVAGNGPDWDFCSAAGDEPEELIRWYQEACERGRSVVATVGDLDAVTQVPNRRGVTFSLRWILIHMIEETARHAGHADLLRESIDGVTGD